MTDEPEYMNARDAARYLGVHRSRLYQLAREGLGTEIGGYLLFTKSELDAYKSQPKSKGGRPKSRPLLIRRGRAAAAA